MKRTFSIYVIRNTSNAKIYVGKAADPQQRWYGHTLQARRGDSTPVHRAMRKYGLSAFMMDVIAVFFDEEDCFAFERAEIARLRTCDRRFGYNISSGGEGPCGVIPSAETRKRMSAARKGRPGHKWTDDERARHIAIRRGRKLGPRSEEQRARHRVAMAGHRLSDDAMKKAWAATRGRPISDEHRAKISAASKGRPKSEETRRRMSEAAKRRWAESGADGFNLKRTARGRMARDTDDNP